MDVEPSVWRRVQVPRKATLSVLHKILQIAMGWEDVHLHEFIIGKERFGPRDPEAGHRLFDEKKFRLEQLIERVPKKFEYLYDFGDGWRHELNIENELTDETSKPPLCLEGLNACPPEDCGGPLGYANLLTALGDSTHTDDEVLSEWVGSDFNPTLFDLKEVNRRLAKLK